MPFVPKYDRPSSELELLSSIFVAPQRISDVRRIVRVEDFAPGWNRSVYRAMLALEDSAQPIDLVTLRAHIEGETGHPVAGIYTRLIETTNHASSAAHLLFWAGRVASYGRLDSTKDLGRALWTKAEETHPTPTEVSELLDDGARQFFDLQRRALDSCEISIGSAVRDQLSKLDRIRESGAPPGLSTGLLDLDRMLGGFRPGELILLAARPSVGKSALAWQLAVYAATKEHAPLGGRRAHVYFVSLEMNDAALAQRHLSSYAEVNATDLSRGRWSEEERDRMGDSAVDASGLSLTISDAPAMTMPELRSRTMRHYETVGLDLLVVDYLQLIKGDRKLERHLQVSEISSGLKTLARELQCPVLALSQLNRSLESRPNKRPMLSDLRESGTLEQDADAVMFLHRPGMYDERVPDAVTELILAKHRSGPTGLERLHFDGAHTRFRSSAPASVTEFS